MSDVVLDASAVLALLLDEPGANRVQASLPGALLSTVNLAEVLAKLSDKGMPVEQIFAAIEELGLEIVPFSADQALGSAQLRNATRASGLSLGDRCCLALAKARNLCAYTADGAWVKIDEVEISLIR